jgi:hypothetical protein
MTYTPRPDATLEAELNVLANVYRFILDCHAKKVAAEPDSCNDAAIVRTTEEVSHVEQRPDRPSEIVVTHSRKGSKAWSIFEACLGRNIGRAPTA